MKLFFLLIPIGAFAQTLDVTVLDYAGVPPKVLSSALTVFQQIYREAGGKVKWNLVRGEWRPGQRLRLWDVPGDIVLRICSEQMAKSLIADASVFGLAPPAAEGASPARVGAVFYSRTLALAGNTNANPSQVLGAALAHEMGHLLLGEGAHSKDGIMRPAWGKEDLWELSRGLLVFNASQARRIRVGIEERVRSRATPDSAKEIGPIDQEAVPADALPESVYRFSTPKYRVLMRVRFPAPYEGKRLSLYTDPMFPERRTAFP
jgi:hypothetical protein